MASASSKIDRTAWFSLRVMTVNYRDGRRSVKAAASAFCGMDSWRVKIQSPFRSWCSRIRDTIENLKNWFKENTKVSHGSHDILPTTRIRLWCACLVLVFGTTGCGPGRQEAGESIRSYCRAVQEENLDALYCRSAGASESGRVEFDLWARSQYDHYLSDRDEGVVDIASSGIATVKTFSLGKGTYYQVESVRQVADGVAEVTTLLTFGYGSIDLSSLLPGTTFYVCGTPAGTVHPVKVPYRSEQISKTVLASLKLKWTLVRQARFESCDPGWGVHGIEVVKESDETNRLEWWF
jgi:hypothetical protein